MIFVGQRSPWPWNQRGLLRSEISEHVFVGAGGRNALARRAGEDQREASDLLRRANKAISTAGARCPPAVRTLICPSTGATPNFSRTEEEAGGERGGPS